jgi:hypothetical protein
MNKLGWAFLLVIAPPSLPAECEYCPPLGPPGPEQTVVEVSSIEELRSELASASPDTTLSLADGIYDLSGGPDLQVYSPGVTIRSASGNRDAVIIQGGGNNLSILASHTTVADLTLRNAVNHDIQVHGEVGVLGTIIYNVRLQDSGQQLFKVSTGLGDIGTFGDEGLVACSLLEYTTNAPSDYTNGVLVLAGRDWVIRDNELRRIRGPSGPAGPAILFWKNASGSVVKRNFIAECWRGIALGLEPPDAYSRGWPDVTHDHQDGLVENNVIIALEAQVDAPIENNHALNSRILHNTIFTVNSTVLWSIETRFAGTTAVVKNNLANRQTLNRSPGEAEMVEEGNVLDATSAWFRGLESADFHLVAGAPAADRGVAVPESPEDIDGDARPAGTSPDAGADESDGVSTCSDVPPSAPTGLTAVPGEGEASLDWDDNPEPDVRYRVYRAALSGGPYSFRALTNASEHVDTGLTNGVAYHYVVTAVARGGKESDFSAEAAVTPGPSVVGPFIRGDCNADGFVTGQVSDAIFMLNYNFLGTVTRLSCVAACDADGDGKFSGSITDPIFLLNYNFLGGPPPPRPHPECGFGTTSGDLLQGCEDPPEACL